MKSQRYRVAVGCLCLIAAARADRVAADSTPEQAKWNANFYLARSKVQARVNGVDLGTTVKTERGSPPGMPGEVIRIEWSLRYSGPRHPFSVLKPSLAGTGAQTSVIIYAEGTDGKIYEYRLEGTGHLGPVRHKTDYLTLDKGKDASGTITVAAAQLRAYFTEKWPKAFGGAVPVIHLQLCHAPVDRGEAHELDAWTGTVHGPLEQVALKSW